MLTAFSQPPMTVAASSIPATATRPPVGSMQPLKSLLNPDGTLKNTTGFTGSLNTAGYRMETAPGGAPRFVPTSAPAAVPADSNWDDRFGMPGVAASGLALAVSGTNVYLGGNFTEVAGVTMNYIARWNGRAWSPLGSGLNGIVRAIAVNATGDVYAGGSFTIAGGTAANLIAMWNGTTWSALGSGMSSGYTPVVNAIAIMGADANQKVYAGGDFDMAGGIRAVGVAAWYGAAWHSLGTEGGVFMYPGVPSGIGTGKVNAFAVLGTILYVGGEFQQAGDKVTNSIAGWDGVSWSTLGTGAFKGIYWSVVNALATDGTDLFAGGDFDAMSGVAASRIARWHAGAWSNVGGGMSATVVTPTVEALSIGGGLLYAGGIFDSAGTAPAGSVARFNLATSTWSALGTGLSNAGTSTEVKAIATDTLGALVTGNFFLAGGRQVNQIARWTGTDWKTLGEGFASCSSVKALAASSAGDVYAGGDFAMDRGLIGQQAGNTLANRVARWDGARWHALPGATETDGTNGVINTIALDGGDVYVGGNFTSAGGVSASNVARWDGHAWSQLAGGGTDGVVYALAILGDYLYVGGQFRTAGTTAAPLPRRENIARWNLRTGSWSRLGAGLDFNADNGLDAVKAIAFWQSPADHHDYVLVAGWFDPAYMGGPLPEHTYGLLQWDSSTTTGGPFDGWKVPGGGVSTLPQIEALAVLGNDLYVGGSLSSAGRPPANTVTATGIVTQDLLTNQWSTVTGTGVGGGVYTPMVSSFAVAGSDVFVGGYFTTVSGTPASAVARWSSTARQWSALGSGLGAVCNSLQPLALALTAGRGGLFVGGEFITAGTIPSSHIAVWALPATPVSAAASTMSATPVAVRADGIATSTITVTVKDAAGFGIPGRSVSLARIAGPGTPIISPASAITNGSGVATFTVRSTTEGTDTFQATVSDPPPVVTTQTALALPVVITQTVNVTFYLATSTTFYFAEGYTGSGFTETLSLLMPNQSGVATIDYYLEGGVQKTVTAPMTAGKVTVVDVNATAGPNHQVSAKVTLPGPGVAERVLHFNTGSWYGSTDQVGVTAPSTEWDFAEGSTLAFGPGQPIFSEYLTLQNPNNAAVPISLNYFTDTGLTPVKKLSLPANSRTTVEVFNGDTTSTPTGQSCVPNGGGANCGLGLGIGGVSVQVKSNGLPIIAERPFYVNNFDFGDGPIKDGHDAFGATAPATTWNFAEGTTLTGFKEYLTLQNPSATATTVTLNYFTNSGAHPTKRAQLPAHSRVTVEVFRGDLTDTPALGTCIASGAGATCGVGPGIGGVSVQVNSSGGVAIVAERPMYMYVNFGTGAVAGAHVVVGAKALGKVFGFAAASTLAGENDYLTIQNPGAMPAPVTITYYANSGPVQKSFTVPANSRVTVEVFRGNLMNNPSCSPAAGTCGVGANVSPLGIVISAQQPILVEKPTYNSTSSGYGATDTLGYSPIGF
jgi:hypothetical protein